MKTFGYDPKCSGDKFVFELDDLNHGATQVVMFAVEGDELPRAIAKLEYIDATTVNEDHSKPRPPRASGFKREPHFDPANYAIGLVAESLKKSATASNRGDCRKAERALKAGLEAACRQVDGEDPHLDRVVKIAEQYRTRILDCIERFGD